MKVLDIALNDIKRSLRSLFLIGMAIFAPLLLSGLFGFAFGGGATSGSGDLPAMQLGIVNQDSLPSGAPLQIPLGTTIRDMFFDESVKNWISATDYSDSQSVRSGLERGEIGIAVVIPAGFTEAILTGKTDKSLLMIHDPTLTITPQIVKAMLSGLLDGVKGGGIALQTVIEREKASGVPFDSADIPGLIERYQTWYQESQRAFFHDPTHAALVMQSPDSSGGAATGGMTNILAAIMVGQMIFFAFYTGAYAMMSILREQDEGTLARLFTTPVSKKTYLAGKFLAVAFMVFLQGMVLILAGRYLFGINWGNPLTAGLALLGQVCAATGLGIFLISLVKKSSQVGLVLGGGLTVLGMAGGLFTVAVPNLPASFNLVTKFTPHGWVLATWQSALNGAQPVDLLVPLAVCIGFGVAMFAAGAVIFRRRLA